LFTIFYRGVAQSHFIRALILKLQRFLTRKIPVFIVDNKVGFVGQNPVEAGIVEKVEHDLSG